MCHCFLCCQVAKFDASQSSEIHEHAAHALADIIQVSVLNKTSPLMAALESREVGTGAVEGGLTVIAQGLAAGDKVVIDGADKLRDGAKVAPVSREAAEKAANAPAAENHSRGARRASRD